MKFLIALVALAATAAFAQTYVIKPTGADPVACAAAASAAGGVCLVPYVPAVVVPPPVPVGVSITAFGAKCDGKADDSAAIAAAIASAKSKGVPALIPAATCAYAAVINLDGAKLQGQGDSSVLYSLNRDQSAVFLRGSGAEIKSLKMTGVTSAARTNPWESCGVVPFGATNFRVENVTIIGHSGAGIHVTQGASQGTIYNNRVLGTLSDSIHITSKSSYITVTDNVVENSGDDGVAVISYASDGGDTHHITARGNTIRANKWGRNMSVVGGTDVLYENNKLLGNPSFACVYIAQEGSYNTRPAQRVTVQRNTIQGCGSVQTGHAAVMVYSDGVPNVDVNVRANDIVQDGRAGIRAFGPGTRIVFDGNRITGANPAYAVSTSGALVTPYASGAVGAP